jgi:hypothetical protein
MVLAVFPIPGQQYTNLTSRQAQAFYFEKIENRKWTAIEKPCMTSFLDFRISIALDVMKAVILRPKW